MNLLKRYPTNSGAMAAESPVAMDDGPPIFAFGQEDGGNLQTTQLSSNNFLAALRKETKKSTGRKNLLRVDASAKESKRSGKRPRQKKQDYHN